MKQSMYYCLYTVGATFKSESRDPEAFSDQGSDETRAYEAPLHK